MSKQQFMTLLCESISAARVQYAEQLAESLQLVMTDDLQADYILAVTDQHLELRSAKDGFNPIWVDFLSAELAYRCAKGGGAKQMIARAVGIKGSYRPSVLDATAGLGKDAFILARLGCDVQCLERSPIVAALLKDGLDRFFHHYSVVGAEDKRIDGADQSIFIRPPLALKLMSVDAVTYLSTLNTAKCYDVIYLDPMFPEKQKSALPKKEMRVFRQMLGSDDDAAQLLQLALKHAKKRVVVKRPRFAATISSDPSDLVFVGKSSRFDVYTRRN